MVRPFPPIEQRMVDVGGEDRNPAVQLLGRRFFADQTVPELLVEFLLVVSSPKQIGETQVVPLDRALPGPQTLRAWPDEKPLEYAPKARLNLKLFAFLGASKLDTRHQTHCRHYRELIKDLQSPAKLAVSGTVDAEEVLRTLENLFLGLQGVGGDRTWCAQSFVPVGRNLVAGESIWRETRARTADLQSWDDARSIFAHSQRLFLARGGELLYLQICNALRQAPDDVQGWCAWAGLDLSPHEANPEELHAALEDRIQYVLGAQCPKTVDRLAAFIDTGVDAETASRTDQEGGPPRYVACGWCPVESWPEGFLFAVELLRLCQAAIDPMERLELMEVACAMQVLRSLCAQSARYVDWPRARSGSAGPLSFVWAMSDPEGRHTVAKQISRRCVNAVQRMIHQAVRHPGIQAVLAEQEKAEAARGRQWRDPYREADGRYGHKLFLTVAKRIGLIVPKRGAGARFVLNDRLLRFLVLSVIRPGERVTYEVFKQLLLVHYGIAVDDPKIGDACEWSGTQRLTTLGGNSDAWLVEMLDAAGVLRRLSDSCSLVENPFGPEEGTP